MKTLAFTLSPICNSCNGHTLKSILMDDRGLRESMQVIYKVIYCKKTLANSNLYLYNSTFYSTLLLKVVSFCE